MYFVKKNFKAKKELGVHKIGPFDNKAKDGKPCYSDEEMKSFIDAGLVVKQSAMDAQDVAALEKKLADLNSQIGVATAQLNEQKKKLAPSAPAK